MSQDPSSFRGTPKDLIIQVDPDFADIVPDFLMRRQEDVALAKEAVSNDDFKRLKELAHTIKGISIPYGFVYLDVIARELEQAAVASDLINCKALITEMDYYVQKVTIPN